MKKIKAPVRLRKNFAYGYGYVIVKDDKYLYDQKFYEDIEDADIIDDYDEAEHVAESFGAEFKRVKLVNGKTVLIEE